jgi:predicted dehydrogenase
MLGTRHGHAVGKWQALAAHPGVEPVGIYDPDPLTPDRFAEARWLRSADELLQDASIAAKHVWFDKPAGDDWPAFQQVMQTARQRGLHVQLGYMFRYSPTFARIGQLARGGEFGELFAIRAHMSTNVDSAERREQSRHRGGILYDLGGHMLDQIVWLLGQPTRIHSVLQNVATLDIPAYVDNALAVLEFEQAIATLEIAAMEPRPAARRFEVYGTRGSAILEPSRG